MDVESSCNIVSHGRHQSTSKNGLTHPIGFTCLVAVGLVLGCMASLAQAAPLSREDEVRLTQRTDFSWTGTPADGTALITPFDPALGTLNAIYIDLHGSLHATGMTPPASDHTASVMFEADTSDGTGFNFNLSPGLIDLDNGANHNPRKSKAAHFNQHFDLAFYFDHTTDSTGTTSPTDIAGFSLPMVAGLMSGFTDSASTDPIQQQFTFSQIGGSSALSDITGSGRLDVAYVYSPSLAPEPSSAALLLAPLLVILTRRRRRPHVVVSRLAA